MHWRGRSLVLAAIIATLVVPSETFALPLLWWVNKLPWFLFQDGQFFSTTGWPDTYRVQIFPFLANAFSIHLFYSCFQRLKVLWGQIMACSVLVTVPVLVLFLALQRQFLRSIAAAGVEG